MKGSIVPDRHFQVIHAQNTYYGMFTLAPDGLPIGLTSHCEEILDQINKLPDDKGRGILFSYDAFSKSNIPYIDRVQTLPRKYDQIRWYDITEREAELDYNVIVLFGTFKRIQYEAPLLWRFHIENGSTPVVFYTSTLQSGFEKVDFDEILPRIRFASHREPPHHVIPQTETPHLVEIGEVKDPVERRVRERNALIENVILLRKHKYSYRKIAKILGISLGSVQHYEKQKPYVFLYD